MPRNDANIDENMYGPSLLKYDNEAEELFSCNYMHVCLVLYDFSVL